MNPAQGPPVATYQTRVSGYVGLDRGAGDAALAAYAELYGQVERKLFADVAAGRSAAPLKRDYMREHGMPARMFNAVRVSLDGKVSAVRESQQSFLQRLARSLPVGVVTPARNCSVLPQPASLECPGIDAFEDA